VFLTKILGQSVKHEIVGQSRHESALFSIRRAAVSPLNVFVVIDWPLIIAEILQLFDKLARVAGMHAVIPGRRRDENRRVALRRINVCCCNVCV
jgi:hypothetical protein